MTSASLPEIAVAEQLAQSIAALDAAKLPQAVRRKCEELLIDVVRVRGDRAQRRLCEKRAGGLRR